LEIEQAQIYPASAAFYVGAEYQQVDKEHHKNHIDYAVGFGKRMKVEKRQKEKAYKAEAREQDLAPKNIRGVWANGGTVEERQPDYNEQSSGDLQRKVKVFELVKKFKHTIVDYRYPEQSV